MPVQRGELRYAHGDGHCDVTYDVTTGQFMTGGSEGEVRLWREEDGDLEAESHRVGERVLSLVTVNGKLYTAIENNTVQIHSLPDCEPDGLLTRFTAPVNHISTSNDQQWIAAGASDFAVKVISVDQSKHRSLSGHTAPVLSVALYKNGDYCASSSCDGTVKVWKTADESCLKTIDNVLKKCSDVRLAKGLCRLAFSGERLFVPVGKEVHVYGMDWTKTGSLDCTSELSIVCASHCGKFLAASTVDGAFKVWNIETKKLMLDEKHENGTNITALKWHPKKHQLTYCDSSGHFGQFDDVINDEEEATEGLTSEQYANLFDSDDEDFSAVHEKAAEKGTNAADQGSEMDEGDINDVLANMSDTEMDETESTKPEPHSEDEAPSEPVRAPPVGHDCYKPTPLQRPFQPRSTPEHLAQRFMVWNQAGVARQYSTDDENTIDVEFHDSSTHHRMTLVNDLEHRLADLNTRALVLANEELLVCTHFATWDSAKEWSVTMPKGESITGLTLGEEFVAVSTDKRQVRVFSIGGLQRSLFSVAGPVLTTAAYLDKLAVVYHSGTGVPGDQCLSLTLINMETKANLETRVSLSPKSTLAFLGFSDEGTLFTMDSHGVLRMMNERFGKTWIQVCQTGEHAKGKTDTYWVVGISESQFNIRCILCKGANYPAVLPRPTISLLPWKIPLCQQEKSMIEETYLRSQLSLNYLGEIENPDLERGNDLAERESLMKLFALSCKQGHEYRALEVCRLMPDCQTVQLAIKYASRLRLIALAEKLNELAREKQNEQFEKEMEEQDQGDVENTRPDTEEEVKGPMLVMRKEPKSLLSSQNEERKNPFKTSKDRLSIGKGSSVFDEIVKENKPASTKQSPFGRPTVELKKTSGVKKPKQKEIIVKAKVSAFDVWYEENKADIAEENADKEETEWSKIAVTQFRALSREEKQVWVEKAKSGDKRKRENSGDGESKKLCL